MTQITELPAVRPLTLPLAIKSYGDRFNFNARIVANLQDMYNLGVDMNALVAAWNTSRPALNGLIPYSTQLIRLYQSIAGVDALAADLPSVDAVAARLSALVAIYGSLDAVLDAANQADKATTQATIATKAADRAVAVSGVDVATPEVAGLARGDWDTMTTDNGILSAPAPIVVPWTLTAAVAVDDLVPVPRAYIVGKNEFVLYKNGTALAQSDYEEVGPDGELSTLIRAKITAASGDKLMLYGPFSMRPMLVIDPSQGVVDPRLVCTRAGATYVTGQDGKIVEVAANTVPIDWSTGKGRIACFGKRTRLNWYYKTHNSRWSTAIAGFMSIAQMDDTSSPTGTIVRCGVTYSENRPVILGYSIYKDIDINKTPLEVDTTYTVQFCARANREKSMTIGFLINEGEQIVNPVTLTTEFKVFNMATIVRSGSYLKEGRLRIPGISQEDDGLTIDVAYIQVEQSPCATPLIAGTEGQQVTAPGQCIRVADNDFEKTDEHFDSLTVFSEISALENSKMMKRRVAYIGTLSVSSFFDPYLKGPAPFKYELACRKDAEPTIVTLPQTTPMASKACFRLSNGKMTVATKAQYSDKLLTDAMAISKERLFVGSRAVVNDYILDGYICKLLIWPIALPDAQLKALTAE